MVAEVVSRKSKPQRNDDEKEHEAEVEEINNRRTAVSKKNTTHCLAPVISPMKQLFSLCLLLSWV